MHPDCSSAYIKVWTEKQKRDEYRVASVQLTIAQSQGMKLKNGRNLELRDFLPEYAKPEKKCSITAMETEVKLALLKQKITK